MDKLDKKILQILQTNCRLSYKEIGEQVGLSSTPVYDRVKRMEQSGIIQKYVAMLDRHQLDSSIMVFCHVTLTNQTRAVSENFRISILELPQVIGCYFVSGDYDCILKIVVANIDEFHEFHQKKIGQIEGVSSINSQFVMSEWKNETIIPLR